MIEKWNITIPELTGDTQRGVYVYLPESLKYDSGRRCPVLYMFDGHNVFFDSDATYGKSWGMKEYMDYTQTQVIIAAVECSHSPDHGRLKEYSPYTFSDPDCGAICGCGRITMEWMTKTFKPLIDSRYPTLPDRKNTYIAGSSMGGLMSLYAVLEYNHVYSRAAALSPSLWTSPSQFDRLIRQAHIADDTVIYMDFPRWVCVWGAFWRELTNLGRSRPDMGGCCPERINLPFLKTVWNFNRTYRARYYAMLQQAPAVRVIVLKNRRAVRKFLDAH